MTWMHAVGKGRPCFEQVPLGGRGSEAFLFPCSSSFGGRLPQTPLRCGVLVVEPQLRLHVKKEAMSETLALWGDDDLLLPPPPPAAPKEQGLRHSHYEGMSPVLSRCRLTRCPVPNVSWPASLRDAFAVASRGFSLEPAPFGRMHTDPGGLGRARASS